MHPGHARGLGEAGAGGPTVFAGLSGGHAGRVVCRLVVTFFVCVYYVFFP